MKGEFTELKQMTGWTNDIVLDFVASFLADKNMTKEFLDYCSECFKEDNMDPEDLISLMHIAGVDIDSEKIHSLNQSQLNEAGNWVGQVIMLNFEGWKDRDIPLRPKFLR